MSKQQRLPVPRKLLTQARDFLKEDTDSLISSHSKLEQDPAGGTRAVEIGARKTLLGRLDAILRT